MSIAVHPAFELIREQTITTLNLTAYEFKHKATGASHFHLAADNKENVFLVALRTMPMDNTGVAHILEHTALCGSERFPVRDPFFMMIRRSLNTFMNAFTSSDWTAYPFASQNRKDFFNLLDVYLDATFFSLLDPLDFAQEGHRLEFTEKQNPQSDLEYKGIVFNEMKGAMSSVSSQLWQHLTSALFPSNTYHYNSGGDPAYIPDLTHEQLLNFYKDHYHPSNAIFMTFGDIPASELQQQFEEKALSKFQRNEFIKSVPQEKPFVAPRKLEERYSCTDESLTKKTHHVFGWLLGEATDLSQLLKAQLLSAVLMDNSACPVMHFLETSDLGKSPSPLCGLEDSHKELVLVCGLEGSNQESANQLEKQLFKVLENIAENGVDQKLIDAMMHQLELHQREISGDGYPYGLQLILQCMPGAVHHKDALALLDIDLQLQELKTASQQPNFIQDLVKQLLLNNRHYVRLSLVPDDQLSAVRDSIEKNKLKKIKDSLTENQQQEIIQQSLALETRQQQVDDVSILPKVTIEDVPAEIKQLFPIQLPSSNCPLTAYAQATNGLVYQQIVIPLPELSEDELNLIPLYCNALTETGIGELSYVETQSLQAQYCGSLSAFTQLRAEPSDEQSIKGFLVLSGKALASNAEKLDELIYNTLTTVRLDEYEKLRELMQQQLSRREQSISGNGHALAMAAATAELSPQAWINHQVSGLAGIEKLRKLVNSCQDNESIRLYSHQLNTLHKKILNQTRRLLFIADEHQNTEHLSNYWKAEETRACGTLTLPSTRKHRKEIWRSAVQVNYCAAAFATVPVEHPDAAALTVLGGFLRNGYLHRVIREQGGAYGGGANQDNNIACFKFYSYRDPQFKETINAFYECIDWMLETEHTYQALEESILGVISSLDKPGSPAGEAKIDFYNKLFGRDHQQQLKFRQAVLAVTLDDLKRVTETYLKDQEHSLAVVTHTGENEVINEYQQQGFTVRDL